MSLESTSLEREVTPPNNKRKLGPVSVDDVSLTSWASSSAGVAESNSVRHGELKRYSSSNVGPMVCSDSFLERAENNALDEMVSSTSRTDTVLEEEVSKKCEKDQAPPSSTSPANTEEGQELLLAEEDKHLLAVEVASQSMTVSPSPEEETQEGFEHELTIASSWVDPPTAAPKELVTTPAREKKTGDTSNAESPTSVFQIEQLEKTEEGESSQPEEVQSVVDNAIESSEQDASFPQAERQAMNMEVKREVVAQPEEQITLLVSDGDDQNSVDGEEVNAQPEALSKEFARLVSDNHDQDSADGVEIDDDILATMNVEDEEAVSTMKADDEEEEEAEEVEEEQEEAVTEENTEQVSLESANSPANTKADISPTTSVSESIYKEESISSKRSRKKKRWLRSLSGKRSAANSKYKNPAKSESTKLENPSSTVESTCDDSRNADTDSSVSLFARSITDSDLMDLIGGDAKEKTDRNATENSVILPEEDTAVSHPELTENSVEPSNLDANMIQISEQDTAPEVELMVKLDKQRSLGQASAATKDTDPTQDSDVISEQGEETPLDIDKTDGKPSTKTEEQGEETTLPIAEEEEESTGPITEEAEESTGLIAEEEEDPTSTVTIKDPAPTPPVAESLPNKDTLPGKPLKKKKRWLGSLSRTRSSAKVKPKVPVELNQPDDDSSSTGETDRSDTVGSACVSPLVPAVIDTGGIETPHGDADEEKGIDGTEVGDVENDHDVENEDETRTAPPESLSEEGDISQQKSTKDGDCQPPSSLEDENVLISEGDATCPEVELLMNSEKQSCTETDTAQEPVTVTEQEDEPIALSEADKTELSSIFQIEDAASKPLEAEEQGEEEEDDLSKSDDAHTKTAGKTPDESSEDKDNVPAKPAKKKKRWLGSIRSHKSSTKTVPKEAAALPSAKSDVSSNVVPSGDSNIGASLDDASVEIPASNGASADGEKRMEAEPEGEDAANNVQLYNPDKDVDQQLPTKPVTGDKPSSSDDHLVEVQASPEFGQTMILEKKITFDANTDTDITEQQETESLVSSQVEPSKSASSDVCNISKPSENEEQGEEVTDKSSKPEDLHAEKDATSSTTPPETSSQMQPFENTTRKDTLQVEKPIKKKKHWLHSLTSPGFSAKTERQPLAPLLSDKSNQPSTGVSLDDASVGQSLDAPGKSVHTSSGGADESNGEDATGEDDGATEAISTSQQKQTTDLNNQHSTSVDGSMIRISEQDAGLTEVELLMTLEEKLLVGEGSVADQDEDQSQHPVFLSQQDDVVENEEQGEKYTDSASKSNDSPMEAEDRTSATPKDVPGTPMEEIVLNRDTGSSQPSKKKKKRWLQILTSPSFSAKTEGEAPLLAEGSNQPDNGDSSMGNSLGGPCDSVLASNVEDKRSGDAMSGDVEEAGEGDPAKDDGVDNVTHPTGNEDVPVSQQSTSEGNAKELPSLDQDCVHHTGEAGEVESGKNLTGNEQESALMIDKLQQELEEANEAIEDLKDALKGSLAYYVGLPLENNSITAGDAIPTSRDDTIKKELLAPHQDTVTNTNADTDEEKSIGKTQAYDNEDAEPTVMSDETEKDNKAPAAATSPRKTEKNAKLPQKQTKKKSGWRRTFSDPTHLGRHSKLPATLPPTSAVTKHRSKTSVAAVSVDGTHNSVATCITLPTGNTNSGPSYTTESVECQLVDSNEDVCSGDAVERTSSNASAKIKSIRFPRNFSKNSRRWRIRSLSPTRQSASGEEQQGDQPYEFIPSTPETCALMKQLTTVPAVDTSDSPEAARTVLTSCSTPPIRNTRSKKDKNDETSGVTRSLPSEHNGLSGRKGGDAGESSHLVLVDPAQIGHSLEQKGNEEPGLDMNNRMSQIPPNKLKKKGFAVLRKPKHLLRKKLAQSDGEDVSPESIVEIQDEGEHVGSSDKLRKGESTGKPVIFLFSGQSDRGKNISVKQALESGVATGSHDEASTQKQPESQSQISGDGKKGSSTRKAADKPRLVVTRPTRNHGDSGSENHGEHSSQRKSRRKKDYKRRNITRTNESESCDSSSTPRMEGKSRGAQGSTDSSERSLRSKAKKERDYERHIFSQKNKILRKEARRRGTNGSREHPWEHKFRKKAIRWDRDNELPQRTRTHEMVPRSSCNAVTFLDDVDSDDSVSFSSTVTGEDRSSSSRSTQVNPWSKVFEDLLLTDVFDVESVASA